MTDEALAAIERYTKTHGLLLRDDAERLIAEIRRMRPVYDAAMAHYECAPLPEGLSLGSTEGMIAAEDELMRSCRKAAIR